MTTYENCWRRLSPLQDVPFELSFACSGTGAAQPAREVARYSVPARTRRVRRRTVRLLREGLPPFAAQHPDFPFIVIAPQCPWNTWWPELADWLDELLRRCGSTLPIDHQRLYLTGLSMGGFGSWYLGSLWPQRFAAVVPICGGGLVFHGFPARVQRLKETRYGRFTAPRMTSCRLPNRRGLSRRCGNVGGKVQFTVYPDAAHDSWTETYNNPELYRWFLSHRLGA
jgi:predicted peptidase